MLHMRNNKTKQYKFSNIAKNANITLSTHHYKTLHIGLDAPLIYPRIMVSV